MVLGKHEIEAALHAESQEIVAGRLKEDNPLDDSEAFRVLCEACRRGDLKVCQERITEGVNINARDRFDYTPLILASLCGHFEVVQLLLESGALCERDTFQGERCLYNALNDRIRNLLLSYDYSKSRDPLQPLAGHVTSLLKREVPQTSDIIITTDSKAFHLHKFLLSARSPYFSKKLAIGPETTSWKIPSSIPSRSLEIAILALYFGEVNLDIGNSEEDQAILVGIDKLGRQLEIGQLLETILESDRRVARQRRTEEAERGRNQLDQWFQKHVLAHSIHIDTSAVDDVKWDKENSIFADVLLCAEVNNSAAAPPDSQTPQPERRSTSPNGIPIGPLNCSSRSPSCTRSRRQSTIFPVHRAMLLRSEYFSAMFSSPFKEAQPSSHLPIVRVDCSPAVLKVILTYLYTERADFGLDIAVDVLFAADQLFIEKLKIKAAVIISTLGNGAASVVESANPRGETDIEDVVDIYDVVRAGWDTRMHRLDEFGARYIAYRLERFIEEEDFKELVKESAARIQQRQETDTVELIDDIRYYLSERFRLRFEEVGLDEMTENSTVHTTPPVSEGTATTDKQETKSHAQISVSAPLDLSSQQADVIYDTGVVRTLDGDVAGDEFAQDALNYQILLGKIDKLLEGLKLEA